MISAFRFLNVGITPGFGTVSARNTTLDDTDLWLRHFLCVCVRRRGALPEKLTPVLG